MRTQCRCSRRTCRARRTLAKHPDQYVRAPRCHIPGCDGFMRPATFRNRVGSNDGRALCRCDGVYGGSDGNAPHRKGTKGCVHHEDMKLDAVLSGRAVSKVTDEPEW